jgi:hypothetical protein
MIFNRLSSPFEKQHRLIHSFTAGGSIYLLQGTAPFFRVLLYEAGLEVRFMLHCFFIPYEKMADPQVKTGLFSSGFYIESDLPTVPSQVYITGMGIKKHIPDIQTARKHRLEKLASIKQEQPDAADASTVNPTPLD